MSRRQLYQDLAAIRALVADGRDRLRDAVGDLDQFWVNSARRRLETIDDFLVTAAGGLGGWTRSAIGAGALAAGAAVTAVVTKALGFPAFWVVVCSWVGAALVEYPVRSRLAKLAPELARRRLTRAAGTSPPRRSEPLALAGPEGVAALVEALAGARVRLVSVALREAGSRHWRVPYLAQVAAGEPTMHWLSQADTLLCQAIDHLERYLATGTKGTA
jgi:hypothetical protein